MTGPAGAALGALDGSAQAGPPVDTSAVARAVLEAMGAAETVERIRRKVAKLTDHLAGARESLADAEAEAERLAAAAAALREDGGE